MSALPVGSTIGILGTGQLGRMLACAAAMLGFDVVVFGPEADSPAARVAADAIVADYTDEVALKALHERCDRITLEFENVPVSAIEYLTSIGADVRPGASALNVSQDRLNEKTLANSLGISSTRFAAINSAEDVKAAQATLGDGILKTRRDGYDGHGQVRLKPGLTCEEAYQRIGERPAIYEALVPFQTEISVILARRCDSEIVVYDCPENHHEGGILRESVVPANVPAQTRDRAMDAARRLANHLDYVGVMAVEFFVLEGGDILFNEMAPRVHNSGHWTQGACFTSQFEQHIRAIADWPLGSTERFSDASMKNLLGDDLMNTSSKTGPKPGFVAYGKRHSRYARKMGHFVQLKTK